MVKYKSLKRVLKDIENSKILGPQFYSIMGNYHFTHKKHSRTEIIPETYFVDASKKSTIELPTGSKIEIPDSAFVNESGELIKGKVTISWNEYHTLTDILLSGIPMKYDSLGKSYDLVSGGMFKINATQKSKEVFIAKNKNVKVDIASINDTPCMNFYELEEKTGKWDYKMTKTAIPEKETTKVVPEVEKNDFSIIEVNNLNTDNFSELKNKTILGWKTNKKISKKEERFLSESIISSELAKTSSKNNYTLAVNVNGTVKSWNVSPYTMEEAIENTNKLSGIVQKEQTELLEFQRKILENKITRSVSIAGFGVFNWDCASKLLNCKHLIAQFKFPNELKQEFVSIFIISPDENRIVSVSKSYGNKIAFNPSKRNCIIAILPTNKILFFNNKDFEKVKNIQNNGTYAFKLKDSEIFLNSGEDLQKYLNELI